MILNRSEVSYEEKLILQEKFNEFRNDMLVLIRNSNLFTEDFDGHFSSKSTREYIGGNISEKKPLIIIESSEYWKANFINDHGNYDRDGCNSFNIMWTKKIGKEKISTGLLSTKEIDTFQEHHFFPMYLDDECRVDYYKERQNYNWFLDELKNYKKDICITSGEMKVLKNIFPSVVSEDTIAVRLSKNIQNFE